MVKRESGGGGSAVLDKAKAAVHPTRRRALALYLSAGKALSPKDIAVAIHGKQFTPAQMGEVSYHVKELVGFGFLELVELVPARGAVKHLYVPTAEARMDETSLLDELAALLNAHTERARPNPRRTLGDVADVLRVSGRSVAEVGA